MSGVVSDTSADVGAVINEAEELCCLEEDQLDYSIPLKEQKDFQYLLEYLEMDALNASEWIKEHKDILAKCEVYVSLALYQAELYKRTHIIKQIIEMGLASERAKKMYENIASD